MKALECLNSALSLENKQISVAKIDKLFVSY